ncbi:hypothetical protein BD769DRAFT_1643785 [Suillus cothurnatus]|nr:hypothetical protein BD769DRAFT_1643785 [Suillus cothurnatus]
MIDRYQLSVHISTILKVVNGLSGRIMRVCRAVLCPSLTKLSPQLGPSSLPKRPMEQDRVGVILPLEAPYLSLTEGSLSSSLVRLGVNRIPYFGLGSGCGAHINIDVAGANGSVILGSVEGEDLGPRRISAVDRKRSAFCGIFVPPSRFGSNTVQEHRSRLKEQRLPVGVGYSRARGRPSRKRKKQFAFPAETLWDAEEPKQVQRCKYAFIHGYAAIGDNRSCSECIHIVFILNKFDRHRGIDLTKKSKQKAIGGLHATYYHTITIALPLYNRPKLVERVNVFKDTSGNRGRTLQREMSPDDEVGRLLSRTDEILQTL